MSGRAGAGHGVAFAGDVAVVTGGTRGIGAAISRAFLAAGARVHAIYNTNEAAARAFAEACAASIGIARALDGDASADARGDSSAGTRGDFIAGTRGDFIAGTHGAASRDPRADSSASAHVDSDREIGERLSLHRLDVADYAAVEKFWQSLEETEPAGVQILVNNAGIRRDAIVGTMKPEEWNQVIATNLTGSFHMSRFAVRSMLRERYGRILFVTSPAASFGFQGQANYSASKAGQVGLMRSLAREVAKKKITVNCVSPGFIDTELIADLSPTVAESHLASVPLGRLGRPEEVAYAVLCLAAREATYINGATLEVTGGI